MTLAWIIAFCAIGSLGSIFLASLLLWIPASKRKALVPLMVSFATGTLLGTSFLGLLPEALETLPTRHAMYWLLGGILLFFLLERSILWRHCHDDKCPASDHGTAGPLILVGDSIHNFVDGIIIAAAFMDSIHLGVATSIAVLLHEIPQELSDFAVLLDSKYSKAKALKYNLISGLATFPGAISAYFFLTNIQVAVPYVMAIAAASFIYISMSDLVPNLHKRTRGKAGVSQILLLFAGVGLMVLLIKIGHSH